MEFSLLDPQSCQPIQFVQSLRYIAEIIYYILVTACINSIAAFRQKSLRAAKRGDVGKGKSTDYWYNSEKIGLEALEKANGADEQAKTDVPGASSAASAAWTLLKESVEVVRGNADLTLVWRIGEGYPGGYLVSRCGYRDSLWGR